MNFWENNTVFTHLRVCFDAWCLLKLAARAPQEPSLPISAEWGACSQLFLLCCDGAVHSLLLQHLSSCVFFFENRRYFISLFYRQFASAARQGSKSAVCAVSIFACLKLVNFVRREMMMAAQCENSSRKSVKRLWPKTDYSM